ncbi:hypothetical protein ACJJTC_016887 [Scirpophaga incertulas]
MSEGYAVKILEMPLIIESRSDEHPSITLNSIHFEKLHSLNTQISMQPPVQLQRFSEQSLYHTTILVSLALITVVASRRLRKRFLLRNKNTCTEQQSRSIEECRSTQDVIRNTARRKYSSKRH